MLPNHAPLMVAERFKVLEALFPGRIDLGLGRAPGTDPVTSYALRRRQQRGHRRRFPGALPGADPVREQRLSGGSSVPQRACDAVRRPLPPIWLLGSSGYSAQLAGMVGAGFSFAHHFSDYDAVAAMLSYREHFRPSQALDKPYAMLGGRRGVRRHRRGSRPARDHARSQLGAPRARRICCRSQARKRRRTIPTRRSTANASATAARGCSSARPATVLAQLDAADRSDQGRRADGDDDDLRPRRAPAFL